MGPSIIHTDPQRTYIAGPVVTYPVVTAEQLRQVMARWGFPPEFVTGYFITDPDVRPDFVRGEG